MLVNVVSASVLSRFNPEHRSQVKRTHATISSAILTANLPTLVPPYFCTSHLAEGSIVFWCRFGGVAGPEDDSSEGDERGSSSSDIFSSGEEGLCC